MKNFDEFLDKNNIDYRIEYNDMRKFYFINYNRSKRDLILNRAKRYKKYVGYDFRCNYEVMCLMFTK